MARYYFDLFECGNLFADDEGQELASISDARNAALRAARDLMASEVQKGELCLSCRIDVVDQERRPVLTVPFKEAVRVSGI